MTDQLLARCCSPTLAGIKTANMFNADFSSEEEMNEQLRSLNRRLSPKGIRVVPLRRRKGKVLLYVFRPAHLAKDISCPQARQILARAGYKCTSCSGSLCELIKRLSNGSEFPHEVGLFLGYPPEDVDGFINHKDEGVLAAGCWKVYSNKERAENLFSRYRRCTKYFCEHVRRGSAIDELAVADR